MTGKGVAVLFTVKNVGNSSQTYFATDQKLMDSEGRQFSVDSHAMASAPMSEASRALTVLWTDINPGIQLDVAAIFVMPEGAKPTLVVLHESTHSPGVTVNLT
ncbi:MAG: Mpr protein [Mycobacterium sp.]|nr:Mpr protein [Mycobacterium sp.]